MQREAQEPPTGLLDRLQRLPGYTWDGSRQFRSSYGVWHTFGTKHFVDTTRSRHVLPVRPRSASSLEHPDVGARAVAPPRDAADDSHIEVSGEDRESAMEVVARISESPSQEEKAQEEYRRLAAVADPHYNCLLRPLEAKLLPSRNHERESPLVACIYESPGPNDLMKYVDGGATWYCEVPELDGNDEDLDINKDEDDDDAVSLKRNRDEPMPQSTFLDFAIGAAECIKILHSQQIVHGEIRADAFHFSEETGRVKLIHLGAGLRRYHSDLTNATWSAVANQDGATSRISYMSPEQTGRTPIQPDSRADIYSLGILLWSALVQEAPFCGRTPMEIIRAVLGEELPLVSSLRPDVPDLIARVIAKATAKNVSERYHSVSGLQHDLVELRRLLAAEDPDDEDNDEGEAATAAEIDNWTIGSKDVSPFFTLPRIMVGRTQERNAIVEILDRTYQMYQGKGLQLSSLPEGQFATFDALALPGDTPGEEDGHNATDGFFNLLAATASGVRRSYPANTARMRSPGDSRYGSFESIESAPGASDAKTADKRLSTPSIDTASVEGSSRSSDSAGRTGAHRMMVPKGRCELITIEGGAGLGKTRLITSVQIEARQRGFFASSRFDPAAKERLRPVLQLFSSLFEQAFSENTIEPSFLPMLRNHIGSAWNTLHKVLGLPKFLLGSGTDLPDQASKRHTPAIPSSTRHTGTPSSQEFLRTGSSTKSLPLVRTLLDILRAFSRYKPLCLCLDDVHFADEESLELVAQIISARIRMVVILAYRPENASSEMTSHILDLCANEAGFRKGRDVGVTTITLSTLNEDSVMDYVANTLYLSVPLIIPLRALRASSCTGKFLPQEDQCSGSVWVRKQEQHDSTYRAGYPQAASDVDGQSLDPALKEDMVGIARMLRYFKRRIEQWQTVSDVNYLAWSKMLGAQIAEMEGHQAAALRLYQEALDHASTHAFTFEEALVHHLLAGHLIREGSYRLGTLALKEAVTLYRQMGGTGVAEHILQSHDLEQRVKDVREAATQTDVEEATVPTRPRVTATPTDDTSSIDDAVADRALHILDLTSILEASQVISSVLRVDELLRTMCKIIMQSCHGVATLAAIVTNEEQNVGWAVAASGNAAGHIRVHNPPTPVRHSNLVAESIVNYCVRFREAAYLPDVLQDPRFSHVSETWVAQNPVSKSVMALPISPGGDDSGPNVVLYLEGPPNAFSYRTRVVLQLLVVQLGISYSNALTLQEVERVSTINQSMVEAQKQALAEAMAAEQKANVAKAEALHHAKLAEEAAKAKSSFLANISHELRTPLNGVIGNSELLLSSPLPEAQLEMAESIRMSANLLLAVINDILDFSKVEANKMQLHIVPFDVERMVMEVVRSIPTDSKNGRRPSQVNIVHDIQLQETRYVCGDPVRLRQILGNLVGNSLKFTEKGSITVGARAENETEDSVRLSFWVADTGIGIPDVLIPRLFRPFTQADASTARRFGGTGLGLSICKLLVELMGGTVDLKSTEHVGTTVSFALTLFKATPGDSGRTTPTRSSDGSQAAIDQQLPLELLDLSNIRLHDLRVCIAEDNLINQKITVQFLKKLGFTQIDTYNNGLEAVEGIQEQASRDQPYHMILMDVQMPVMDGYDATRRLRQDSEDAVRRILIIALTASAIQGDQERCLASGMNDYLAKPVLLGALKKKFTMADTPRRQIVLCFDGTGNTFRADGTETNILKICRMLERTDEQSGIGTEITPGSLAAMTLKKSSRLGKSKTLSQALGKSFDQHVLGGYRFLMRHYRSGAEIYIFGFSRGAYTALFLADMLDHTGLLGPDNEEMIPFIWDAFSTWKLTRYQPDQRSEAMKFLHHCRNTLCRPVVRARFLGLFDAVNSIADFEIFNDMHPSARITRHAVSIDERRSKFQPVLLRPREMNKPRAPRHVRSTNDAPLAESPEALNSADVPAAADENNVDADEDEDDDMICDIEEIWFPGGHSDIGGGHQRAPTEKTYQLSHAPLVWMVQEASRCGLRFQPHMLRSEGCVPDEESPDQFYKDLDESITHGQLHDKLQSGPGMSSISVLAWRTMEYLPIRRADRQRDGSWKPIHWPLHRGEFRALGPNDVIHVSAFRRMESNPEYRPVRLIAGASKGVKKTPAAYGRGEFVLHEHEGDPVRQTYISKSVMVPDRTE
ncbi:hypothetical protein CNMCM6106_004228 [Aspergillus hiratsukae]|uniref:histidine kinase n=1 Tax=Aspergillus hiratsukae TaxID=1194566 RepID=A0A8H6QA49_9EURO|nr:hypothetical protein CNMCM6106_004228 [Aspergillus hiratsukae]